MIFDRNHREVKVGSLVKVVAIDHRFIATFPKKEAKIMESMLNQTFEVTEIEHEQALVYQPFNRYEGFSLALASEEMELVPG
jgi:hypothetical protein